MGWIRGVLYAAAAGIVVLVCLARPGSLELRVLEKQLTVNALQDDEKKVSFSEASENPRLRQAYLDQIVREYSHLGKDVEVRYDGSLDFSDDGFKTPVKIGFSASDYVKGAIKSLSVTIYKGVFDVDSENEFRLYLENANLALQMLFDKSEKSAFDAVMSEKGDVTEEYRIDLFGFYLRLRAYGRQIALPDKPLSPVERIGLNELYRVGRNELRKQCLPNSVDMMLMSLPDI